MLDTCFEAQQRESAPKPSANRVLNFSPVQFDDAEITVGCLPFGKDGKQVMEELRREHNSTHVFRREGPDTILAVSVAAGATLIGDAKTIRLKQNLGLAAVLIQNALLTYLAGRGRRVFSYNPMRFIAADDLLRQINGISPPDWLAVPIQYEVAIRPIHFFRRDSFIAAMVDVRTALVVERSALQLIQGGQSLEGVYVGRRIQGDDPRIAPRLELLGRVKAVEGSRLRLTDSRDKIETVEAGEVWPERRVFAESLAHAFGDRAPRVAELLEREQTALRYGPTRLARIKKAVDFLAGTRHEMAPGVSFKFGSLLDSGSDLFPGLDSAPRPTYIFDEGGSKTDRWNDGGLNQHGPYTARVFTPNRPRICVVCQQSMKGQVEQFLHKFTHGIQLAVRQR